MRLTLTRNSPDRDPDWRWRRAIRLLDVPDSKISKHKEGQDSYHWAHAAKEYLAAYRTCSTEEAYTAVYERFPAIYWAHLVHTQVNPTTRHMLEAYLLCENITFKGISYFLAMSADQIEAYEALFFNVRDRLAHEAYIWNVIEPNVDTNSPDYFFEKTMKMMSYRAGWRVLSFLLYACGKGPAPQNTDQVADLFRAWTLEGVAARAAVAITGRPLSTRLNEPELRVIELYKSFIEATSKAGGAEKAQDQLSTAIREMFTASPYRVGSSTVKSAARTLEFDTTAVELKYSESLTMGHGGLLDNADELRNITFDSIVSQDV